MRRLLAAAVVLATVVSPPGWAQNQRPLPMPPRPLDQQAEQEVIQRRQAEEARSQAEQASARQADEARRREQEQAQLRERYDQEYDRLKESFVKQYQKKKEPPVLVLVNQTLVENSTVSVRQPTAFDEDIENRFIMWIRADSRVRVMDYEMVKEKLAREKRLLTLANDTEALKILDQDNQLKAGVLVRITTKPDDRKTILFLRATNANGDILVSAKMALQAGDEAVEYATKELARQAMEQIRNDWFGKDYARVEVRISGTQNLTDVPLINLLLEKLPGVVSSQLTSSIGAGIRNASTIDVCYRGEASELFLQIKDTFQQMEKRRGEPLGLEAYKIEGSAISLNRVNPDKPLPENLSWPRAAFDSKTLKFVDKTAALVPAGATPAGDTRPAPATR